MLPVLSSHNRIVVPSNGQWASHCDTDRETSPQELGLASSAPKRIWSAVERLYRTGLHPGISLVVRRGGRVLLSRGIGHARGAQPGRPIAADALPLTADTPVCLFSASKAVTAMLIHKLAERGELRLDQPVVDFIPEFGVHGKDRTTILELLSHRGGVPQIPSRHADPQLLFDWQAAVRVIAGSRPVRASRQSYHAITGGFILGEIAQRATGKNLRQLMDELFIRPLGMRNFNFGLPRERHAEAAENVFTGMQVPRPLDLIAKRILGVRFAEATAISNDPRFIEAVVPAGNLYASAEEACRFFQMLLNGGQIDGTRVLAPETVARAVQPVGGLVLDATLLVPVRFSAGMILGEPLVSLYGRNCPRAFGHLGFMNIICWADPDRDLSVALLNTGKSISPDGMARLAWLIETITRVCPRLR